ncbi:Long-chain acyl-[acyl-carrier-protein] reductase [Caloramator mitchellensis]|uniref:Long-chain acyl-[acyl-carrier-protein] reductase n=1 Tax=Caloramator mitchellensis TaxID=908809 RepID=A0A0R3JWJ1_CALMK|nr:NAD(P)H-binding protein [Caloramator mitchellensis]KRQ86701.1 Long-chain acyl-[acyl-carrier-protein] reductase [Caloramator mitchellensis]
MNRFAFIIHPIEYEDVSRKFKFLKNFSKRTVERFTMMLPPLKVSKITGVKSQYSETEGWFVAVPLISNQMLELPEEVVYDKIIKAGKIAEKLGADIVGLGAMTSVVGDAGITIAKNLNIAVTSGNSYTVATAIEGAKKAAEIMGKYPDECNVAVIGATGSIGKVCAEMMVKEAKYLTLVARNEERLKDFSNSIERKYNKKIYSTSSVKDALEDADIIITVTSSADVLIHPEYLKPGAVVCDVARPRDVSKEVAQKRNDVLVIEGGAVEVPGDVNFNFNFGFPPKTSYACMAETMILAMEGRIENYSLGRDLTVEQVEEIAHLAKKHGFKLAGFRSFERQVPQEMIEEIKRNAKIKRSFSA